MEKENKMEIKKVKIEELKPRPKNPKKHWIEKIKESMREFGYVEPIIVDENDMIIAGHGRLEVLKEEGVKEVEVIVKRGLTEKQKDKYLLLSNKMVEAGGWDDELLKEFFDEDLLKDAGWEEGELDEIFGMEIDDGFDAEKELEKVLVGKERRVKEGDLWQLGESHRLYIGDSCKKESWEKVLGDEKFDFMFTDPPYRIGYGMGTRKQKTKNGFKLQKTRTYVSIGVTHKDGKPFDLDKSPLKSMNKYFGAKGNRGYLGVDKKGGVPEYDEWLSIANEFQNQKGANVMIFENWRNIHDLWEAIEKYWKIRNMVIWYLPNRNQGFSAKYRFFSKYDIAPLAGEVALNEEYEEELENYLKEKGQKLLDTYEVILYGGQGKSEWSIEKGSKWGKVADHITWTASTEKSSGQSIVFGTKPIQILIPYLKVLSPRNGIVMEPFGGSGSTIIACEIMKRKCRAIEMSDIYGEVILNRFEKFTGIKPIKLN